MGAPGAPGGRRPDAHAGNPTIGQRFLATLGGPKPAHRLLYVPADSMATYTQSAGGTRYIVLDVPLRAFWSKPRAWHKDAVALHVETAYLPDHTPFKIRIFEACDDVARGELDPMDTLDHGLELVNNRAVVPYTIAWDRPGRGKPLALRGDRFEFYFEVTVEHPAVVGRSNLLYVHLHPHLISG